MFVYARNMKLAAADRLRRLELVTGAGVVLTIGIGFLLSALWLVLARYLGWGSIAASLTIGFALVAVGLLVLASARTERHPVPSADELKLEVEQQLNLLANAAIDRAQDTAGAALDQAVQRAGRVMDMAEHKVHAFTDNLGYRVNRVAERAGAPGETAARHFRSESGSEEQPASRGSRILPILAVVAAGVTLAARVQDLRRHSRGD